MRILLSNDDGYLARPGCALSTPATLGRGSGVCAGTQLQRRVKLADLIASAFHLDGGNGFRYLNGTPTDCVHIALTGVLDTQPDLVISGINDGQNMGEDTLYSGTVAAATEGFMFGVPAFAFSLADKGWAHLDAAARTAADIIAHYLKMPLPAPFLLNINIPNRPYHEMGRW